MKKKIRIVVIGGGAAGYFCAINIKYLVPEADLLIIEKTNNVLSKVRISGGGRCNVTNRISDPDELVKFYPRGEKEMLGPFNAFSTQDTTNWFESRGVKLKSESDGRIFPVTDNSGTIVDIFLSEAKKKNIRLLKGNAVQDITQEKESWKVITNESEYTADYLVIASGSNQKIWYIMNLLGHSIISPVPSLFTFNVKDKRITSIAGVSVKNTICRIEGFKYSSEGPALVTHWGLSGPAILKLSAFAARYLADKNYKFNLLINWAPQFSLKKLINILTDKRNNKEKKKIYSDHLFDIPLRLWERLAEYSGIDEEKRWSDLSNKVIEKFAAEINSGVFNVNGKSTFKEEFVTAGGVDLKEVNFKTMESKLHKNLFFAGEVLDIDAVTGGFNFQSAWTTAWIAAKTISTRING